MQNDFITGSLGTPEAVKIVPNVVDKIKKFDGLVLFTRDTHTQEYLSTKEGEKLPVVHCIKNTNGWQLCDEVNDIARKNNFTIIDKPSFGSLELVDVLKSINTEYPIEQIEVIGLCTDICVISNTLILKAAFPECEFIVDRSCCAGVTVTSHNNALEAMKSCQVTVI